jgi:enoyl-CoA hydratase/carnithine racemase
MGDTSGRFGLLPDEGGAWLFPHVMGYDRALRMTLLHEIYDAPRAYELGLITELVEADLEGRTLDFCEALAAQAPLAVRTAKMMLRRALTSTFEASLEDAQLSVMITNPSQDVREGGAAFREKRTPKFEGR